VNRSSEPEAPATGTRIVSYNRLDEKSGRHQRQGGRVRLGPQAEIGSAAQADGRVDLLGLEARELLFYLF
jgi:hypothetical protein